jgi:predicted component of type VI protein secretion system
MTGLRHNAKTQRRKDARGFRENDESRYAVSRIPYPASRIPYLVKLALDRGLPLHYNH